MQKKLNILTVLLSILFKVTASEKILKHTEKNIKLASYGGT